MAVPFCSAPWLYDDYHEVHALDGVGLSAAEFESICWAFTRAIHEAETVSALTMTLATIAVDRGLSIQIVEPDEHGDPSRPVISVLLVMVPDP